ncbi:MAG: response regulator [Desulfobacteraceae bacterium]|jgi:CheY-like chemotaxis protein
MNQKILVIEDNEQNLYLVTFILEKNGFDVVTARDGQEGIDKACSQTPALILLDIQLPLMDGYEVARRLRQIEVVKETPIIAVTSYAMVGDREKSLDAGCTGYMEKPINPVTFMDQIRKYLPAQSAAKGGGE